VPALQHIFDAGQYARRMRVQDSQEQESAVTVILAPLSTDSCLLEEATVLKNRLLWRLENQSTTGTICSVSISKQQAIPIPPNQFTYIPAYVHITTSGDVQVCVVSSLLLTQEELIRAVPSASLHQRQHTISSADIGISEYFVKHNTAYCLPEKLPTSIEIPGDGRKWRCPHPFQLDRPNASLDAKVRPERSSCIDAGTGLFANVDFEKDTLVCTYGGELLHKDEWDRLSKLTPQFANYGISVPNDHGGSQTYVVDGQLHFGCSKGRYINDAVRPTVPNVYPQWFDTSTDASVIPTGFIGIHASRDIKANEELWMNYGPGYPRQWSL
jgi:hypothetical protein